MKYKLVAKFVLANLLVSPVSAECISPFPVEPTADQLRGCLSEIPKLRAEIRELKKNPPPANGIIAGHYNGGGLDNLTSGSSLTTSIAGPAVRISFAGHNFTNAPIVMLTTKHGYHVYIRDWNKDYVDVITQTINDGRANGSVLTNLEFWFTITPRE